MNPGSNPVLLSNVEQLRFTEYGGSLTSISVVVSLSCISNLV